MNGRKLLGFILGELGRKSGEFIGGLLKEQREILELSFVNCELGFGGGSMGCYSTPAKEGSRCVFVLGTVCLCTSSIAEARKKEGDGLQKNW